MDDKYVLAKPSGILLSVHLQDVKKEVACICLRLVSSCTKYTLFTGKDLIKRSEKAAQIHDIGKKCCTWQKACQNDYSDFTKWQSIHPSSTFAQYCSEVGGKVGANIRKCGVRHEFYSLITGEKIKVPMPIMAAVAAHHGKLGYGYRDRWINEGFERHWGEFVKEANSVIESGNFMKLCAKSYEYNGVRGLLELADHRASAKEEGDIVADIQSFEYNFPFTEKRGVQKLIEEHWSRDILLVRAPTGAGKTDAALLWASKQILHNRADRLVIAMPTRFTSNALSVSISKTLSNTGLYHSSAWSAIVSDNSKTGDNNNKQVMRQLQQARLLLSPVTVCTIDHLLMSLTQTREDHHLIDFNLANSCFVIDEADFYDDFTLANIMFLLKVLHVWRVPVLLMSASLPDVIVPLIMSKTGYVPGKILEDNSDASRDRFLIAEKRRYESFDDIQDLLDMCIKKGNGIVYMNTIDKAIGCYLYLQKRIRECGKNIKVYVYHSHFAEMDKLKRENELLSALGRVAWENNKAEGIVVLTQIGEMSVNISAQIMISDLCPIDRLIQRAGRLCRFSKEELGLLYVILPQKGGLPYPAPYGNYNLKEKKWIINDYLKMTYALLDNGKYNVKRLTILLNTIYNKQYKFSIKAIDNERKLEELFIYNWLINPVEKKSEDDEETNDWKSRDIPPQGTVFVNPPVRRIMKRREFLQYKITSGIDLPVYQMEKARKMHIVDQTEIILQDCSYDEEGRRRIDIVRTGFYNNTIGLNLLESGEEDNFL